MDTDEQERLKEIKRRLGAGVIAGNLLRISVAAILYELLKRRVLEHVKDFFATEWHLENDKLITNESDEYRNEVLALDPKSEFRACLRWYVKMQVLTEADLDTIDCLQAARHYAVHEGIDLLFGNKDLFDDQVLTDGGTVLDKLGRYWGQINADIVAPGQVDAAGYEAIRSFDSIMYERIHSAALGMIEAGLLIDSDVEKDS